MNTRWKIQLCQNSCNLIFINIFSVNHSDKVKYENKIQLNSKRNFHENEDLNFVRYKLKCTLKSELFLLVITFKLSRSWERHIIYLNNIIYEDKF